MKADASGGTASRGTVRLRRADRASLAGMGLGLLLMLLVGESWAFRAGFFAVLVSTSAQILFSHLRERAG